MFGDFELLRDGAKGKLFIIKDRQLFSPSFRPKKKGFELIFRALIGIARRELNPTPEEAKAENPNEVVEGEEAAPQPASPAPTPTPKKETLPFSTATNSVPDTLTNSYIEDTIVN